MSRTDRPFLSSKRGNLRGLWALSRPANLLIAAGTMALLRHGWMGRWSPVDTFPALPLSGFAEGVVIVVLLMAAGNWINAYFDVVEDRINRPEQAIVDRTVKRRVLIIAHPTANVLALAMAAHLSHTLDTWWPFVVALGVAFLLWKYSARWKSIPLVGNGVVAGLIGLVPLWLGLLESPFHEPGTAASHTLWWSLGAYGSLAAGVSMVRELAKDAQDREGDAAAGKDTFAVRYGSHATRKLCLGLLLLIGMAYSTTLVFLGLAEGITEILIWSVPAWGWLGAMAVLIPASPRWDRLTKMTLATLLLGSLQCLWIPGL